MWKGLCIGRVGGCDWAYLDTLLPYVETLPPDGFAVAHRIMGLEARGRGSCHS
jgi:hypothetical protein